MIAEDDVQAPILSLYVRRPAMQVAARLKALLTERGWRLPGRDEDPGSAALEVQYLLLPGERGGYTGVWPSAIEAHGEDHGAILSASLDAVVIELVLGPGGSPFAYRKLEAGTEVAHLGMVAGTVAERRGEDDVTVAVLDGTPPGAALEQEGCTAPGVSFADVLLRHQHLRGRERPVVLRFLPALGDDDSEVVIDPLLKCPKCGSPMVERQGRHGMFYGCAQFPGCRGTLSEREAERARRGALD